MNLTITPEAVLFFSVLYFKYPMHIVPFILACTVHELGHIAMLHCIKHCICRLRVHSFGVVIQSTSLSYLDSLYCALAGPVVNLICSLLFPLFPLFAKYNLCLGLYNLLPLTFLDGGLILKTLLHQILSPNTADQFSQHISKMTGISIFLISVLFGAKPIWILSSCILCFRACCLSK